MNSSIIDIMAERLKGRFPDLSMDEGRIMAYAYIEKDRKWGQDPSVATTRPDGYLDSTVGLGADISPALMQEGCTHLLSSGYLVEHESDQNMVRISDPMISVCEEIVNSIN